MEEKSKKKQIIIIAVSVIAVIAIIVGATVAYFSARDQSEEKTVTTGSVGIKYTDNIDTVTIDNIIPIYDNEIKTKANKFSFNLENLGDATTYVDITLTDITITEALKDLEFKWALYSGDEEINNGNFRNVANNEMLLAKNIEFSASQNRDYALYIWISENDLDQSDMMGARLTAKITVEGNQSKGAELLSTVIKNNNSPIVETTPNFGTTATTDEGLIKGVDDDGETYYFRGAVEDNYVKIGDMDMLWRIVRINGDGTIRLITDDSVGESQFNSYFSSENVAGYTYDNSAPNVQDGTPSTIKTFIDNWYNENMSEYDNLIANTRYCNDTSISPTEYSTLYYGAHGPNGRLSKNNPTPTFICPNTEKTYGGEYDLKVGLISADEAAFAGGKAKTNNTSYYLYLDSEYWSLTPAYHDSGFSNTLWIAEGSISTHISADIGATLPVISLRADTLYTSGDGTQSNPYVISVS